MAKRLALLLSLAVLLGAACPVGGQDHPATNVQLVERAAREAVESMQIGAPDRSAPLLRIQATGSSDAAWLVEGALKERLLGLGWKVAATGQADSGQAGREEYVLEVRIGDMGLAYGKTWRRLWVGGKWVERIARVSFYYDLVDATNAEVAVSSRAGSEIRDVVPASALPALSDSKYPFASPQLEKSQWDKYVEGVMVIAIVGVLVYLFYSNKTAS